MLIKTLHLFILITLTCCSHSKKTENENKFKNMTLSEVIKSDHRSEKNKARDQYRHPLETLNFFGLEPDMTVIEVSPGRGWYTEIIGPYLKEKGTLYLTLFLETSKKPYAKKLNQATKKLTKNKNLFGKVFYSYLEAPNDFGPIAPDDSADLVLTFRNVHSWESTNNGIDAFKAFYAALKPGGILGVVAHKFPENKKIDSSKNTGYLKESEVIKIAKKAGFKFVASSNINHNKKDRADHPNGVWTLPPSLRVENAQDLDKYKSLGESNRMTLKFVK